MSDASNAERQAPAAERNKGPILDVLVRELPARAAVLEIASGTGQHVMHFAEHLPEHVFFPTDPSSEARASVEARRVRMALANVRPVERLDVTEPGWEAPWVGRTDAIVCINMVQVAPLEASRALFEGASRCLVAGAPLVMYGPFKFDGVFLAPGNAAFDASLSSQNAGWGVSDARVLGREAERAGFSVAEPIVMPQNNHVLVFRRVAEGS